MTQAMGDEERETRRNPRQFPETNDNPAVSKDVSKVVLQNKQLVICILRWIDLCGPDGEALACTNLFIATTIKAVRKSQHDQAQLLVDSTSWNPERVGIRIETSSELSFRNSV